MKLTCMHLWPDYCLHLEGNTFLTLDRSLPTTSPLPYPGCKQVGVESCVKAELSLYILMTSSSIKLPDGTQLELSHREDNHVCYKVFCLAILHFLGQFLTIIEWACRGCVHMAGITRGRKCSRGWRVLVSRRLWGEVLPLDKAEKCLAGSTRPTWRGQDLAQELVARPHNWELY